MASDDYFLVEKLNLKKLKLGLEQTALWVLLPMPKGFISFMIFVFLALWINMLVSFCIRFLFMWLISNSLWDFYGDEFMYEIYKLG